jgi:pimeloyl-ACP methyl ester carboxylesterase
LALLIAMHPDSVGASRIIDEVWGDSIGKAPGSTLHTVVSRLRGLVGSDLVTTPGGYRLEPGVVDSHLFESTLQAARRSGSVSDYQSAMELWIGEPYRAVADVPTVAVEAQRLRQLHHRAELERLAAMVLEGQAAAASDELALVVAANPFDEDALSHYMRALFASGRKPEALKAFRAYEGGLAEETGLEPSASIRELELAILVDELDAPPPQSRAPVPMQLSIGYVERSPGESVAIGRTGSGRPILMHPGWLSKLDTLASGLDFRSPFMATLAKSHELIVYDRYGTGLSRGVPNDNSFAASVEELKAVIEGTATGPLPVIGASGAGPIVIRAAVEAPEYFSHLILYGTYASGPGVFPKRVSDSMVAMVRASWGLGSNVLASLIFPGGSAEMRAGFAEFQRSSATAAMATDLLVQMYETDVSADLERVSVPTLVIHYQQDKAIPAAGGMQLAQSIPSSRYVPLEGMTHYPPPGEEQQVVEIIDRFLTLQAV